MGLRVVVLWCCSCRVVCCVVLVLFLSCRVVWCSCCVFVCVSDVFLFLPRAQKGRPAGALAVRVGQRCPSFVNQRAPPANTGGVMLPDRSVLRQRDEREVRVAVKYQGRWVSYMYLYIDTDVYTYTHIYVYVYIYIYTYIYISYIYT